jgi:hypothetical protein
MSERIELERIRVDGTQTRAALDGDTVKEYAAAYESDTELPPVVLFNDGSALWMGDGFHRYAGAKLAHRADLAADVREGTQRDAILFGAGCNDSHGLKRTTEDKANAVRMLLADDEWKDASDRWIADACHVSTTFAGNVRASVVHVDNGRAYRAKKPKTTKKPKTERQPGDEDKAKKAPALCERCERLGVATCDKCKSKGAKPKAKKPGEVIFDRPTFDSALGTIIRTIDKIESGYGHKETPIGEELRRMLSEFLAKFTDWRTKLAGGK